MKPLPRPSVRDGDWLETLWDGEGVGARAGRAALVPFELLFSAAAGVRASLYDAGLLIAHPTAVPALSVGNLTVGGTGKTPLAAWLARQMSDKGAHPAIVLRGYGDDEPLVHRALNPDVPVVVSPDRVAAAEEANRRGCDVVVLDDAFQYRRARRVADVVVISADRWHGARRHLLPAGPWRERLAAVRRASLVVVTRKAATLERAGSVEEAIVRVADIPVAIVHLQPVDLRRLETAERLAPSALRGESILAISSIGDPAAFHAQLTAFGANVIPATFRDHHRFTQREALDLVAAAGRCARAVCTLKDAVKLGPLWPAQTPLWYVSQRVNVERGHDALEATLATVLAARFVSTHSGRPGSTGPLA